MAGNDQFFEKMHHYECINRFADLAAFVFLEEFTGSPQRVVALMRR